MYSGRRTVEGGTPSLTTKSMEVLQMARYTRPEIESLCKRLEARAKSVVLKDQPELVGDLKAASLLLRLMLVLSEIESLQTDHASTH
jgi:hypothetical protein